MVGVNDPSDLRAIDKILTADIGEKNVVAVYVGPLSPERVRESPDSDDTVDDCLKDVFSEVVFSAEKLGRPVQLLALPGDNLAGVLLQAVRCLEASELWLGSSDVDQAAQQRAELQDLWNATAAPGEALRVVLVNGSHDEPEPLVLESQAAERV